MSKESKQTDIEKNIENITDGSVWLVFVGSLICTVILMVLGVMSLLDYPTFTDLIYFIGATITMGIHLLIKRV